MGKQKKKSNLQNRIMDLIFAGVIFVAVVLVVSVVASKSGSGTKQASTATEEPAETGGESIAARYACVVEGGSNDTVFYLNFYEDGTYKMTVQASSQEVILESGTYEEAEDTYLALPDASEETVTYIRDGAYLLDAGEMYQGKISDGAAFDAVCTYEAEGDCKETITFRSDGTYEQELLSYADAEGSAEDTTTTTTGTYERDGSFIKRTSDSGESLLDFYIYEDQISNAYYKLEE